MRNRAWREPAISTVQLPALRLRPGRVRAAGSAREMLLLALFALAGSLMTGEVRAQTVAAGSFEVPDVSPSFQLNPVVTDAVLSGNSGIAHNVSFNFTAPDGDQAGFVQSSASSPSASIALTARNLVVGTSYRIRIMIAKRYSFGANQVTIAFNGTTLGTFSTTSESFVQFLSNTFTPTATTGQITVTGGAVPNTSTLIDLVSVVPATGIETIAYEYDARGRLVGVARTGTVNNNVSTSYTYDKADNRTNVTVTGSTNTPPP